MIYGMIKPKDFSLQNRCSHIGGNLGRTNLADELDDEDVPELQSEAESELDSELESELLAILVSLSFSVIALICLKSACISESPSFIALMSEPNLDIMPLTSVGFPHGFLCATLCSALRLSHPEVCLQKHHPTTYRETHV